MRLIEAGKLTENGEAEYRNMVKKEIVLFGTGKYFENYMMCFGEDEKKRPVFAVDNDVTKAGSMKCGVPVRKPDALLTMKREDFYVVICTAKHAQIGQQLEAMGITDYQCYKPVPMENAVPMELTADGLSPKPGGEAGLVSESAAVESKPDISKAAGEKEANISEADAAEDETDPSGQGHPPKPYRIGYVPGVFDLFHIGHLNLLRNAKSRCEYLIVGVLTDELVEHFKKRRPVIPYAQRAAIIGAVSYVDRVVPVDFSNTKKIDAWRKYHYDCHFSGNDHGTDWLNDLQQLREVGSDMEFFEYTRATSSTKIRNQQGLDGAAASEEAPATARKYTAIELQNAILQLAEEIKSGSVAVAEKAAGIQRSRESGYRTPDRMKRTWEIELAMLDQVDRICKKHDLQYFFVHGSLLGAVRHKGFIPWDDDLDIAMPRKDYDRFIELASAELPDPLSIHTPSTEEDLFWGGYARIRNSRTAAIEPREMEHQGNLGIWVDILPFDTCTPDDKKLAEKEERIRYCQRLIYAERYGRDFRAYAGLRPRRWKMYRLLAKAYGHDRLCRMLEEAQRLYTEEDSDQIAFFTGMGKYRRLSAADFAEAVKLEFEGRMVPVPIGYENYLFALMGRDYMKYPPEEERKPKHRGIYDPERPYTEYIRLLCDTFADVKGKKIILFGAGLMFEDYMKKYGDKYRPAFLVDNDESKWGRSRMGIPIRKPEEILEVPLEQRKLIICSFYYREISEQLDRMGIRDYKVYVQEMEWILRTEEQYEG